MWRMSVTSSVERSARLSGVEAEDSGDEWEIGLGDLIIDLDADLEKDRRRSEMSGRALGMRSAGEAGEEESERERECALDGLGGPGAQPTARASLCKEARKFKEKRRHSDGDGGAYLKRREPQGRPGELGGMSAATAAAGGEPPGDVSGSCAKGREGKRGRNQGRALKRDAVRARKDAAGLGLGPVPQDDGWKEKPCYCGDNGAAELGRGAMDAGMRAGAIVEGACSPERAPKTVRLSLGHLFHLLLLLPLLSSFLSLLALVRKTFVF